MDTATMHIMSIDEVARELQNLEDCLHMPIEAAEELAAADQLDAGKFQVLRRIRNLRWLIEE